LPFLPNNADIRPGDLLITSGLGGTFPSGYPVGVVDDFTPITNKPFVNITATPKAMLDRNRELLIVWSDSSPVSLTTQPTANEKTSETHPNDPSARSGLTHEAPAGAQAGADGDE
jgi:rod shape-determining protein MreC